jgi:hypothetical protein
MSTFVNIEPGPALNPMSGFVRFWSRPNIEFEKSLALTR